jgi:ATP-dependent RNA helicase RhlE
MPFAKLGLTKPLLRGVQSMGYGVATSIQLRAIPPALEGRDLVASAQTGTGKTAAFALPILQRLGSHGALRCLVLEPTRELATQIESSIRDLARMTDLRVVSLYGGVGYGLQRAAIKSGVDVVVATPGRLEDFLARGDLQLNDLKIVVLDEVDRMLDVGFLSAVRRILLKCPKDRQTLLFSATLPPEIGELAAWALRNAERVEIGVQQTVAETVAHGVYLVEGTRKFDLLLALLKSTDFQSALIFARTKRGADKIAKKLRSADHSVAVLHANRSQNQRAEALHGFRCGRYEVMVATDIAARGIDVAGISHVINYDPPQNPEDYIHRLGRTGRAQHAGDAVTLVTPEDFKLLAAIEHFIDKRLKGLRWRDSPKAPPLCEPKNRLVRAQFDFVRPDAVSRPNKLTTVTHESALEEYLLEEQRVSHWNVSRYRYRCPCLHLALWARLFSGRSLLGSGGGDRDKHHFGLPPLVFPFDLSSEMAGEAVHASLWCGCF